MCAYSFALIKMNSYPTQGVLIFIFAQSFWIWLLDLVEICSSLLMAFSMVCLCSHHHNHFMKQIISGKLLLTSKRAVACTGQVL
jgi:hypothetical protein